jgi:hypothetical protein
MDNRSEYETKIAFKRNNKSIPIIIGILFVLFIFMCVTFYILPIQERAYRERVFCTKEDDVYTVIHNKHAEWIKQFQESGGIPQNIWFETTTGKKYEVSSEQWDRLTGDPVLFIVTDKAWQNRLGDKGYYYSPGKIPAGDARTQVKYLDNDIYCYTFQ